LVSLKGVRQTIRGAQILQIIVAVPGGIKNFEINKKTKSLKIKLVDQNF
jgi:hypothetical protein